MKFTTSTRTTSVLYPTKNSEWRKVQDLVNVGETGLLSLVRPSWKYHLREFRFNLALFDVSGMFIYGFAAEIGLDLPSLPPSFTGWWLYETDRSSHLAN